MQTMEESSTSKQIADLKERMDERFDDVAVEFRRIDSRFETVEADIRELRRDLKSTAQELRQEIKSTGQELRQEIKSTGQELRQEIKANASEIRKEMKEDSTELRGEIAKLRDSVESMQRTMLHGFFGLGGAILTLAGMIAGFQIF
jgi:gas vesicle protein